MISSQPDLLWQPVHRRSNRAADIYKCTSWSDPWVSGQDVWECENWAVALALNLQHVSWGEKWGEEMWRLGYVSVFFQFCWPHAVPVSKCYLRAVLCRGMITEAWFLYRSCVNPMAIGAWLCCLHASNTFRPLDKGWSGLLSPCLHFFSQTSGEGISCHTNVFRGMMMNFPNVKISRFHSLHIYKEENS